MTRSEVGRSAVERAVMSALEGLEAGLPQLDHLDYVEDLDGTAFAVGRAIEGFA